MGVWNSFKNGLQVGAGFFVGYFIMRFLTLVAMIVTGLLVLMVVCVPKCEQYDRTLIAPIENKAKVKIVNPTEVVWPKGCRVRTRPSTHSKIIGQVVPGRRYIVLKKRGQWTKIGGFRQEGWVGCRSYKPGKVIDI